MATEIIKLTNYINKIEKLYETARTAYEKTADELNKLEERHNAKKKSGELSNLGLNKEFEQYNTERKDLLNALAEIRNEFSNDVSEVRKTVEELFRSNYRAMPENIDLQACEMIKSGMLSDGELLELAQRYKADGNLAMYRFVGCQIKDAEKSHNQAIKQLATDAHRKLNRDDLSIVDSFTNVCLMGLRDSVSLANGINNRHEDFYIDHFNSAKNITAEITAPWSD